MIGAGLLSLWRRPTVERPVTPPSQPSSAERLCDLSRTELRGALACHDVVDEAVRAEGHVLTASEASALAFAE